jgi:hypothetical protein
MKRANKPVATLPDNGGLCVRSEDGVVEFRLRASRAGLFVERVEELGNKARVVQSTVFRSATSFGHWCDADHVKFDYPIVYVNLKRNGFHVLQTE